MLFRSGLALVNPRRIRVATPRRVRAKLPEWIQVVNQTVDPSDITTYELIPSTTVAHAIAACRGTVIGEQLLTAIDDAHRQGLINSGEQTALRAELQVSA